MKALKFMQLLSNVYPYALSEFQSIRWQWWLRRWLLRRHG